MNKIVTAAALAVLTSAAAEAATFSGSTSGEFTGVSGAKACYVFGISWCDGASETGNMLVWPDDVTPSSTLTFDAYNFATGPLAVGSSLVQIGSLTWYNASSSAFFTPDKFGAKGTMSLTITNPSAASGSEKVSFKIKNTENVSGTDDIINAMLVDGIFDYALSLPLDLGDGVTLTGFSAKLANGTGTFADGKWTNPENSTSVLGIYASIDVAPVPLPAGGLLLISGLGGLAAMIRRKKMAA